MHNATREGKQSRQVCRTNFNVEGLLILQKGDRIALSMVGGCSMVSVLFLELFVSVVQILIDSLVRAQSFRTSRAMYLVTSLHESLHCPSLIGDSSQNFGSVTVAERQSMLLEPILIFVGYSLCTELTGKAIAKSWSFFLRFGFS